MKLSSFGYKKPTKNQVRGLDNLEKEGREKAASFFREERKSKKGVSFLEGKRKSCERGKEETEAKANKERKKRRQRRGLGECLFWSRR